MLLLFELFNWTTCLDLICLQHWIKWDQFDDNRRMDFFFIFFSNADYPATQSVLPSIHLSIHPSIHQSIHPVIGPSWLLHVFLGRLFVAPSSCSANKHLPLSFFVILLLLSFRFRSVTQSFILPPKWSLSSEVLEIPLVWAINDDDDDDGDDDDDDYGDDDDDADGDDDNDSTDNNNKN